MCQHWYKNGKRNECERYQRYWLSLITGYQCCITNTRINIESCKLAKKTMPLKNDDGFEWTENFDGQFQHNNIRYYVNFKFVCGSGGAQTRTLREVYWFIRSQIGCLKHTTNVKFINILDGNAAHAAMSKFRYLNPPDDKMYVGDLSGFSSWWEKESRSVPVRQHSWMTSMINSIRLLVNLIIH